jgi:hypothetical protein
VSVGKVMVILFWDEKGPIMNFEPWVTTRTPTTIVEYEVV